MSLDAALVEALRKDWRTAELDAPERAMLGYVEKITRDPVAIGREELAGLRAAGFDDTGILQITLIAAFFNYINRVADALGVGRE